MVNPRYRSHELSGELGSRPYIDVLCSLAAEYNDKLAKKLAEAKTAIRETENQQYSNKDPLRMHNEIEISSLINYFKKTSSPLKKLTQQMSSAIEDLNLSSGQLIEFDIRLAELEYHRDEIKKISQKLNHCLTRKKEASSLDP